ncbi:hypothetical protein KEM60_01372 [Austwickia sp. TVS 96-490-7B]|uniref:hypothetical protein n=1 Tax=Austwickia sp. TVS 96-490-7B TaxID=2830843 RepID=UPI001C58BF38|nr:hypothetical protein [Austwickia sp. TVS 96-490-7B]MBW3085175.1 hypothetical protein [Austwickia sp. TVS 96-490-7B]
MNVRALFDKLLTDLADLGVEEGHDDTGAAILTHDGIPFARLDLDDQMAFRAIPAPDAPADAADAADDVLAHADELVTAQHADGWVIVPADDVAQWESLARKALATT